MRLCAHDKFHGALTDPKSFFRGTCFQRAEPALALATHAQGAVPLKTSAYFGRQPLLLCTRKSLLARATNMGTATGLFWNATSGASVPPFERCPGSSA